jgi:hypothetical protein
LRPACPTQHNPVSKIQKNRVPEIRRITVQNQQILPKTLSQKYPSQKRADGVAQGIGPELKPQNHKEKKIQKRNWLFFLI